TPPRPAQKSRPPPSSRTPTSARPNQSPATPARPSRLPMHLARSGGSTDVLADRQCCPGKVYRISVGQTATIRSGLPPDSVYLYGVGTSAPARPPRAPALPAAAGAVGTRGPSEVDGEIAPTASESWPTVCH